MGVEADVMRPGTVRDPALDYEVAPHLVGVVAQVVALLGHVFMLPPARAGPHRVLFGLGEVTTDAGELGGGGLGEDDGPVWVLPGGQEGETVPKQVGACCFEDPTAVDEQGDEAGQITEAEQGRYWPAARPRKRDLDVASGRWCLDEPRPRPVRRGCERLPGGPRPSEAGLVHGNTVVQGQGRVRSAVEHCLPVPLEVRNEG